MAAIQVLIELCRIEMVRPRRGLRLVRQVLIELCRIEISIRCSLSCSRASFNRTL